MNKINSVAVFCGSKSGANPLFIEHAKQLGKLLAQQNIKLIYGGGSVGLMGIIADAVLANNGQVTGIIPHFLDRMEVGHKSLPDMHKVETMHERKALMEKLCDGIITLPGGYGSMDELFEILSWSQLGLHHKPVGLLNLNGFYDHLLKQLGVMVDFTHPKSVYENVRSAIAYGIRPVVGTTGLSSTQIDKLAEFADKASIGCLIIPNFSIGMVLLQQAAVTASQYFEHVEIIELHHNQKADAPSGTAIQTAQMLAEMGKTFNVPEVEETEKLAGARGSLADEGIRIHSIRLPGLIAHQEVIFGGEGQVYTLRHDTSDRACYMPGVLLSVRKVLELRSLVYGLEKIL